MKYIITTYALLALAIHVKAQSSIERVLSSIEKSNTSLRALRLDADAEKTGNKTGLFLQNPEVEFNYLWGSPDVIGNRTDLSVRQSFDFPTAYSYRRSISEARNLQADLAYESNRRALLTRAYHVCIELTYRNSRKALLSERLSHARELANVYNRRLETGDANILEANKTRVNLLTIIKEAELNELERIALEAELKILNGGEPVSFTDTIFPALNMEPDFDTWYKQVEMSNPDIQWLAQESVVRRKQEQLSSSLTLPQFSAGYMSERIPGEEFQGVTVGVSIPLWENKNTVKYAKAKSLAVKEYETDTRLQFYNSMKALHTRVTSMLAGVNDYRSQLETLSNTGLLRKALDLGEISLSEYLLELSAYYEAADQLLEADFELNKSFVEVYQYQMK